MKVVARHKYAPLVALEDGSIIDTEDLEVVGTGLVAGGSWEINPAMDADPRWIEIARADQASLGVTERKLPGERTFRAPGQVRIALSENGVDSPLAGGQGVPLSDLNALLDSDQVTDPVVDWIIGILNKHEANPDLDEEQKLFSDAEPELDYDEIDAAMDADSITADASVTPPPGDFAQVVYIAIIEEDDTQSVQDLVALVKANTGASDAYTYGDKGWIEDPTVLTKLTSPAPPPIRQLEEWQTASVMDQIQSTASASENDPDSPSTGDDTVAASAFGVLESSVLYGPDNKKILSIVAAKGVRNSHSAGEWTGNAERLRQYWEHGKGAAKIRWNTPGDWKRCYRHLSKYLGPRAAGYCQLMHHRTTGTWTGSRNNVGGNGHHRHAGLLDQHGEVLTAASSSKSKSQDDVPADVRAKAATGKYGYTSQDLPQSSFDEKKHARYPKGDPRGGQFAPGKARNSSASKAQSSPAAKKLYNDFMQDGVDQKSAAKNMSDAELINLSKIVYSSATKDPDVVKARLAVAAEMAHRGYDVKDFGALGGGINSDKGKGENWDLPDSTPSGKPDAAKATDYATKAKNNGGWLDVSEDSDISTDTIDKLMAQGWTSKPDDGKEALYPPASAAKAPPKRHGHYGVKTGPDGNGTTTYNDGWSWDGTNQVWVPPKK